MDRTKNAWKIAKEVHKNQKRYNGQPYITHIEGVVELLKQMGITDSDIIIPAILHDVREDGGEKYAKIIYKEFGFEIAHRVHLLTHFKEFTYDEYIYRMLPIKECVTIKIADMIHNLTETPTKKQREKYRKVFPMLVNVLIRELT